jgi:hypothetical protein
MRCAVGCAVLAVAAWQAPAWAQPTRVEVGAHLGYQWGALADETTKDEGVDSLAFALGVHSTTVFGMVVDYHLTRTLLLEAVWDQQPTQLDFIDRAADTTAKLTDLRVHYYHAGLVYSWSKTMKQPFVGMTAGLTRWQAREGESESGFSFAPVFGYKTWMSDRFGLRVHLRFLITNLKAGELFENADTGFSYTHTKNTWATQMNLGLAVVLGL